jgi:hypothetical protein
MEDAMVSSSTGAMNSVLTKLATLMEVTGTDEQELILRQELRLMNGLLKQLSDMLDLNHEIRSAGVKWGNWHKTLMSPLTI